MDQFRAHTALRLVRKRRALSDWSGLFTLLSYYWSMKLMNIAEEAIAMDFFPIANNNHLHNTSFTILLIGKQGKSDVPFVTVWYINLKHEAVNVIYAHRMEKFF